LAIRGKLVKQNENDEPAAELLSRIGLDFKNILLSENPPFPIPANWAWTSLSHIGTISPRNDAPDHIQASFVPMNLIEAKYGVEHGQQLRFWGDIKKAFTHFAAGDVGLAKITPCFQNGKSTVFRDLANGIGAGTTELLVVRPILVNPDYILAFLKSSTFIQNGIPHMTGTAGQKRVPRAYFEGAPFPLPPLEEQYRIIAKLSELLTLCDELELAQQERERRRDRLVAATLHALANRRSFDNRSTESHSDPARFYINHLPHLTTRPEHLNGFRASVLALGFRGRLVQQERGDTPASETVLKVSSSSVDIKCTGEKTATVGPHDLPEGWVWARFPELGKFARGKSKHRPRGDSMLFTDGMYPFVQTGDVARSGGIIRNFTGKYNGAGLAQSAMWPKGTMCITIAANIADTGVLQFDACFPDSIVGFVPDRLFPEVRYFEYFMRTAKANLMEYAPATAQKNINLGILEELAVPIAPVEEQIRIVAKINSLFEICDELESVLSETTRSRSLLLESLLYEALKPSEASLNVGI
jgi:type I restriction enzyme S subunit